ncbi:hypothetical protein ACERIT_03815 [Halopenitus sp. H-Gu1]
MTDPAMLHTFQALALLMVWCSGVFYGMYRYERRTQNRTLREIF